MRIRLLIAAAVLPLALWAVLPLPSQGASPQTRLNDIQKKIQSTQGRIGKRKGTERVLTTQISAYSARIDTLQARIGRLQRRQATVQADLDRKRAELTKLQGDLRAERRRLVRLRSRLAEARTALAQRLVELYQADKPDIVTVILDAKGFADLLERGEFMERVSDQDRRIIGIVRAARADATATEARLERFERRQRRVTAIVLANRNEIANVKEDLVGTRVGLAGTRSDKRRALFSVRSDRQGLEDHLDALRKDESQVRAKLASATTGFTPPPGGGSGRFIWPVNGPITGSFGEQRPGHIHAGIDIAAPGGTPIRAAGSGTVVLLGWTGGYGNYTCIQHTASLSTCYAHQSRYGTSLGASVSQGEVIGYVGNTGHSFGDHLHFEVRVGGAPTSPLGYL
jgi:murein DD-endopeptidase MepM/ murein hydrolase activator NlpD